MAIVVHQSDMGEILREARDLGPGRRRLSALLRDEPRKKGRPYIVSVHKRGPLIDQLLAANGDNPRLINDDTVKERAHWKTTTVGPNDVVIITYLPLGGMGGGGRGGGGKGIAGIFAMLLGAVFMPMLSGAIGGLFGGGIMGKLLMTGLVIGVNMLLSSAMKPKANKEEEQRPVYGISGGGNVPRPGDRIPVHYGKTWSNPDLSQPDFFRYEQTTDNKGKPDSVQLLYKRMTIGLGEYDIHEIRVGASVIWKDGVLKAPFTEAEVEIIEPGTRSKLVPSSIFSNEQVNGIMLPRPEDNPRWSGPFPVVPPEDDTNKIQIDWSLPYGLYAISAKNGKKIPDWYRARWEYAEINADDVVTGTWKELYTAYHQMTTTRAQRFTKIVSVPRGRYAVRGRHELPGTEDRTDFTGYNDVQWDGIRGWLDKAPLRPNVTEIAMKIPSSKATGNISSFSDIWVRHTRKLPVWDGLQWSAPQATRKAIWAAVDAIRNTTYGYGAPDFKIDLATFLHYASTLTQYDTFDATIRGPVPVAEAVSNILGVIRGEPVLIGDIWTMVRDEARTMRKHHITRRQIVQDSTGVDFDLDLSDGSSDIIIEYFVQGDPRRRHEQRVTIGAETITPRRIQMFGVTDHEHAHHLAKWLAAVAYYRREHRLFTTERLGRNLDRNDPALIDTWFMDATAVAGVEAISDVGYTVTLDADVQVPTGGHAIFRNKKGQEWGPVAITSQPDSRTLVLDAQDVATIESWHSESFSAIVRGRERKKLPATVRVGTVDELTVPYIIRTARPDGMERVQVAAVIDAPEVWSVLGEAPPPQPPIKDIVWRENELLPILPWLRANVVQKTTGLVVSWAVGEAKGAVGYVVDISYASADGDTETVTTWENIHYGAGLDGEAVVEYRDEVELTVRAMAYNAQGIMSQPIYTTCTLFKPVINGGIVDMLVELEQLQEQVRHDIAQIGAIGEETLRGAIKKLEEKVEELADAAATEAGDAYESRKLVKVKVGEAWAAIQEEINVRVEADNALVERIDSMAAQWGGDINAAITEERRVRVEADNALAEDIVAMRATVGQDTDAKIAQEREVRVTAEGAIASDVTSLSSRVGSNELTISNVVQSVDGVKAQYGVVVVADSRAVGGFRLEVVRKLDGSWQSQFGILGDLVVDGTIWGTKVAAANVITASAQIGWALIDGAHIKQLTVDNSNIRDSAITQAAQGAKALAAQNSAYAASTATVNVSLNCRSGARVVVLGYVAGKNLPAGTNVATSFAVQADGGNLATGECSSFVRSISQAGDGSITPSYGTQDAMVMGFHNASAGGHTYSIQATNFYGGTLRVLVMELAK